MQLVGAIDTAAKEEYFAKPDGSGRVPLSTDLDYIITSCQPEVLVDFSVASATMPAVRVATARGVNLVIGTTGLAAEEIKEIERLALAHQVGAVVAPNFALGAVLMMHLARIAARYFDYAEIIELHHHLKADAPSGTALSTARAMAEARGRPFDVPQPKPVSVSRGESVAGVAIHSVRLPGLLAHQEVIFGGPGQTLSLRHDTISRECFMPGVIMAIKKVVGCKGLIYGLDTLLGLKERP
jgi:4-hydroxy-tetrahydrodipicolinate reductase